jgi:DNA-binding NtrC family response regulator
MNTINLLLVDDEERFLTTTQKLLTKRGLNTLTSSNGRDALRILSQRSIDVVLLDIKMPGIDGMKVLQQIKHMHPDIEVILLTGHISADSAVEGLGLGAFDYLVKPLTIPEIQDKVEEAFAKKQAHEEKEHHDKMVNRVKRSSIANDNQME